MCLAVPGKIISINNNEPLLKSAKVSFGGILKEVSLAYLPEAEIGNYVIVHVGFALSIVDEDEALKTLQYFSQMQKM
ncbi:HypC/HybG/HupF family hydrogenase formation chaperone [Ancylothrix sp. C2]|uniref:HypC/HybG/HupF family hydrogenase formation chaperone n=1 Tax=Ancylothrix sp. D3o TaxID=2953691 RepID=UPI0021BBB145|nr:HypC/HybG/HupF family hydrogenase formation chaperone [Ancylothrix sp. D3o]MCT7948470.1 HypC/HybG/HupF family hydrogenase formation chaperone [Ancylothrix sp. D3o]